MEKNNRNRHFDILLVEDNPGDAVLLREALRSGHPPFAYTLQVVTSLNEALEKKSVRPDMILLDLDLPDSQGYETFEGVKSAFPNSPIIVLSGNESEELAMETVARGAQDYLLKENIINPGAVVRAILYASGRHRVQRQLVSAERRFSTVLESTVDGLLIVDRAYRICFANRAAQKLLGEQNLLGRSFPAAPVTPNLDSGVPGMEATFSVGDRVLSSRISETEWEERPAYCVSIRDITETKQLTQELIQAREDAFRASQAKSAFLASMSHEIRTPLNGMLGSATLLGETQLTEEQKRYIDLFQRCGTVLLSLINDLLDLSKVESGEMTLDESPFDLINRIEDVFDLVSQKAYEKGVELIIDLDPKMSAMRIGDAQRVQQVVTNLLSNAVKFTERGHVMLRAVELEEDQIDFRVIDTGIGIPQDQWDTIFDSFKQADTSVGKRFGGTGLGLSIAKRFIERMGGRIQLKSIVGQGTTFQFSLKLPKAMSTATTVSETSAVQRVLLVSSNQNLIPVVAASLKAWGLELELASGLEAAKQLIGQPGANYHRVIVDEVLPDGDALSLLDIPNSAVRVEAIVLLFNPLHLSAKVEAYRHLGGVDYWVKPLKLTSLRHLFDPARKTRESASPLTIAQDGGADRLRRAGRKLKILLAEDSEDNREIVHAFLRKIPMEIIVATDGRETVDKFKAEAFDLVLMDMQMPFKDGFMASREIREWERAHGMARTPIVALTAFALRGDEKKCREAGCDYFISKPVSKPRLFEVVALVAEAVCAKS